MAYDIFSGKVDKTNWTRSGSDEPKTMGTKYAGMEMLKFVGLIAVPFVIISVATSGEKKTRHLRPSYR